jgi:membrane-associated protein
MDSIIELFHTLIGWLRDPGQAIEWAGYPGLFLIIFLETGALVAFLPGDSLLVVAGTYAAAGKLNIALLNALLIPAAIIGDATSYVIGSRLGSALYNRPDSRFFKKAHLEAARNFYEKHGGKAIIIARFMPIVRTFVPVVAGAAKMPYRRFATFNVVGGLAWVVSMTFTGYFIGQLVPNIGKHIEKVIIVVVFLSILPGIIQYFRHRKGGGGATPATPPAEGAKADA